MTKEAVKPVKVIGTVAGYVGGLGEAVGDRTLGAQQMLLLLSLYIHGELNQIDLPRYTGVEKSANSRNIFRLGSGQIGTTPSGVRKREEGLGLVEAYDDPLDMRNKKVRLTPKGRSILESVASTVAHHFG